MNKVPALTLAAMDEYSWDAALKLPLPLNPSVELLTKARQQVATYIDWYANDSAPVDPPDEVRQEILAAAERMIEICLALKIARAREGYGPSIK